ncbi:MAG TPA: orotidine-5'-phosphate decarboxylase [Pyrinomonadaceae bacterium]|nr:orotidine-5'-phosphate decarboxylase [Pyrinomonadaceae bacterium]
MSNDPVNKLIVALDVPTAQEARELVELLQPEVGMFKVGSQLFTAAGPEIVREIVRSGGRVFLDLKFHDIPNTVAAAAVEATRLGVTILNVHAGGGAEMMRRTAVAVSEASSAEGLLRPSIIAVTVLTSSDEATLNAVGVANTPEEQVIKLARLAAENGMDGLVASPFEVRALRAAIPQRGFLIVTPGIRPAGTALDDQKRVTSPAAAVQAGADYLVVGRPIIAAKDPLGAARRIGAEIASLSHDIAGAKQEL